jgi:hypothetical protein
VLFCFMQGLRLSVILFCAGFRVKCHFVLCRACSSSLLPAETFVARSDSLRSKRMSAVLAVLASTPKTPGSNNVDEHKQLNKSRSHLPGAYGNTVHSPSSTVDMVMSRQLNNSVTSINDSFPGTAKQQQKPPDYSMNMHPQCSPTPSF